MLKVGDLVVPNSRGRWLAEDRFIGKQGRVVEIDAGLTVNVGYRVEFDNVPQWYDLDSITTKKQRIHEFCKKVSS
jgi:hypothetical protein